MSIEDAFIWPERLKQPPHDWFGKFNGALLHVGFKKSSLDHIVFIKHRDQGAAIFFVYKNDNVLTLDSG